MTTHTGKPKSNSSGNHNDKPQSKIMDRSIFVERAITRITTQGRVILNDVILLEESYNLYCNGSLVVDLHCSPKELEQLAIGHLFCRKLIKHAGEIAELRIEHKPGKISVTTRTVPRPPLQEPAQEVRLTAEEIHRLQAEFDTRCDLYRNTGAAHSCALVDNTGIILFMEDIARHNTLDKIIGEMLLQGISPVGKALIFSGRMAYDMLDKATSSEVKLLIAPGAPSLTSVIMAEERGLTLLGFVRKDNINIYAHPHRVA